MKAFAAIMSGFVVSFGMFVGGLWYAATLLTAEPQGKVATGQDVADLITDEPLKVNAAVQKLERVPALAPVVEAKPASVETVDASPAEPETVVEASPAFDRFNAEDPEGSNQTNSDLPDDSAFGGDLTASIIAPAIDAPDDAGGSFAAPSAHVEWCSNRYRSYRPDSNSYTSYAGQQRPCVSPYADGRTSASSDRYANGSEEVLVNEEADVILETVSYDGTVGAFVTPDHVEYCFNRYRSYRPEDNSYQPIDGGPRRQCR